MATARSKRKLSDVMPDELDSKKADKKKLKTKSNEDESLEVDEDDGGGKGKKERSSIERSIIKRVPEPINSTYIKIISANAAGLRALLKGEKREAFANLINTENPDILCLQEHKLQESHVDEVKADIEKIMPGYAQYYACSTMKKGHFKFLFDYLT